MKEIGTISLIGIVFLIIGLPLAVVGYAGNGYQLTTIPLSVTGSTGNNINLVSTSPTSIIAPDYVSFTATVTNSFTNLAVANDNVTMCISAACAGGGVTWGFTNSLGVVNFNIQYVNAGDKPTHGQDPTGAVSNSITVRVTSPTTTVTTTSAGQRIINLMATSPTTIVTGQRVSFSVTVTLGGLPVTGDNVTLCQALCTGGGIGNGLTNGQGVVTFNPIFNNLGTHNVFAQDTSGISSQQTISVVVNPLTTTTGTSSSTTTTVVGTSTVTGPGTTYTTLYTTTAPTTTIYTTFTTTNPGGGPGNYFAMMVAGGVISALGFVMVPLGLVKKSNYILKV